VIEQHLLYKYDILSSTPVPPKEEDQEEEKKKVLDHTLSMRSSLNI
jgi:hypothetical protein